MAYLRECMGKWLPFVVMAAALEVCPAQGCGQPGASELDLDLVRLKNGPAGRQREAMRRGAPARVLEAEGGLAGGIPEDTSVHLARK